MVKRVVCPNCSYVQELNSEDNDSLRVCPSCRHQWLSMQNSTYQNRKNIKVIMKTANHYKYTLSKYKDKNAIYPFFVMDNNYVEFTTPRKVRQFRQSDLISTKNKPHINLSQELKEQISPQENEDNNVINTLSLSEELPTNKPNLVESTQDTQIIKNKTSSHKERVDKTKSLLETPYVEQVSTLDKIKAFFGLGKKKVLPSLPAIETNEKLNDAKYKPLDKIATQELSTLTKFNKESSSQYEVPKLHMPENKFPLNDESILSLKQRHNTNLSQNSEAKVEKREFALRRAQERELQRLPHNSIPIKDSKAIKETAVNTNKAGNITTIVDPLVTHRGNNSLGSMQKDDEIHLRIAENNQEPKRNAKSSLGYKENSTTIDAADLSSPLNNKDLVNIVAKERLIANNKENKLQQLSLMSNDRLVHTTKHEGNGSAYPLESEYKLPPKDSIEKSVVSPSLVPRSLNHVTTAPIRIKRSLPDLYQASNIPKVDEVRIKDNTQKVSFSQEDKGFKALRDRNRIFPIDNINNDTILGLQEPTFAGESLQEEDSLSQSISTDTKGVFYEGDNDSNIFNNNLNIDNDMSTLEKDRNNHRNPQLREREKKLKELDTLNEKGSRTLPNKDRLEQKRDSLKAAGVSRDRHDLIFTNDEDGGVFYEEFLEENQERGHSVKQSNQEEVLSRQEKRKSLLERRQARATRIRDNIGKQDTVHSSSRGAKEEYLQEQSTDQSTRAIGSKKVPDLKVEPQESIQNTQKNTNIDLHSDEYKELRPFNLKDKMQEFSKEKARQYHSSELKTHQQGVSLTDLMNPEPYSNTDSIGNLPNKEEADTPNITERQADSLEVADAKEKLGETTHKLEPLSRSLEGRESMGQQRLNNNSNSVEQHNTSSQEPNGNNNLRASNMQGSEGLNLPDSNLESQDSAEDSLAYTEEQQFSAKQFLLQKIAEGDKEYLDFLNKKMDTLKSEDIKQALISKTKEIAKQEQRQQLKQEEKLLGANNYTPTDLAQDMKKKVSKLKTPKGYVVLVIVAILLLAGFYFFSASYMSLKKGDQLKKQTVDGIPAIDDKEVADYTVPHGKQAGATSVMLGTEGNNKVAIEVSKDKKNSQEVLKVDREKLDSKKSLEQDIKNKTAKEASNAKGSAIGAKFSKSVLQTKQSVANFFNSVKVYKVNSFWETSNHSPQFKTVVTLYNASTAESYKVQEMELVFVNSKGKKISTRKITPNKVIRAGEFVRINIIFHETSKITADAYVFVKQAVAQ